MTTTSTTATKTDIFGRATTSTLVESLLTIAAMPQSATTADHRMVHAWIADEIERRHPEITPGLEAYFESDDCTLKLAEVIVSLLPVEAL